MNKPLRPDAYALLRLVIQLTPYTTRVVQQTNLKDVNKWKRYLVKSGLMIITGEDGLWERMFPTVAGKMMAEWQAPMMKPKPGKEEEVPA